jgi:allophanate hydrolase subunit 2
LSPINHSAALSSASSAPKKQTKIAFQDNVEVIPIPTRYEYSDRIKSRIWSNRHELQENAERNALEFASEGWNWRNVTEDEGMYICSASGELVHPIHLQHLAAHHRSPEPDECERKGLERGAPVH